MKRLIKNYTRNKTARRLTAVIYAALCLCTAFLLLLFWTQAAMTVNLKTAVYTPSYAKEDITAILEKERLSDADYDVLLRQCGLGKAGVERLIDRREALDFQEQFFSRPSTYAYTFGGICFNERISGPLNNLVQLREGDIIVSPSTYLLSYRIGHAAIVTDAVGGVTVESKALGELSETGSVYKTEKLPAFAILRYPDEQAAQRAAEYAMSNLLGIPYALFPARAEAGKRVGYTNCSHIVWQAFAGIGVDVAPKSGALIMPRDFLRSDKLEIVQIQGLNPDTLWTYV